MNKPFPSSVSSEDTVLVFFAFGLYVSNNTWILMNLEFGIHMHSDLAGSGSVFQFNIGAFIHIQNTRQRQKVPG